jgi:hypothetical protein
MADVKLSIQVDRDAKNRAEYLPSPKNFTQKLYYYKNETKPLIEKTTKVEEIERGARSAVSVSIRDTRKIGAPVALYDDIMKCPYLEYPDGRKEYGQA